MNPFALLLLSISASWAVIAVSLGGYAVVRFVVLERDRVYRREAVPLLRGLSWFLLTAGVVALVGWWLL